MATKNYIAALAHSLGLRPEYVVDWCNKHRVEMSDVTWAWATQPVAKDVAAAMIGDPGNPLARAIFPQATFE